jgi:hypothetical protein
MKENNITFHREKKEKRARMNGNIELLSTWECEKRTILYLAWRDIVEIDCDGPFKCSGKLAKDENYTGNTLKKLKNISPSAILGIASKIKMQPPES